MWSWQIWVYAEHLHLEFRVSRSLNACFNICSFDARWGSAIENFRQIILDLYFQNFQCMCSYMQFLIRDEVWQFVNFRQQVRIDNFQIREEVWQIENFSQIHLDRYCQKFQCTCFRYAFFDTRWELADRELLPTNLGREYPNAGWDLADREFLPNNFGSVFPKVSWGECWLIENFRQQVWIENFQMRVEVWRI